MKRFIAIILAVSIMLSFSACKKQKEEYITRSEFNKMLNASFNIDTKVQDDNETVTGEYAVIHTLKAVGEVRLEKVFGLTSISDDALKSFARSNGIATKRVLKANQTKKSAQDIIDKVIDLLFDFSSQKEYSEIKYKRNVIDIDSLEGAKYKESQLTVPKSESVKPGDIVKTKDKYGFATLKEVKSVVENSDSSVIYELSAIENVDEVIESYSSNELLSFNRLLGVEPATEDTVLGTPNNAMAIAAKVNKKDDKHQKNINLADIEFCLSYSETEKFKDYYGYSWSELTSDSPKVKTYIKVSSDGQSCCFEFSVDNSGAKSLKVITESDYTKRIPASSTFDIIDEGSSEFNNDTKYDGLKEGEKNERESSLALKVSLKDVQILTSIESDLKNPSASVLAKCNFKTEFIATQKLEGKIYLGQLPLPSVGGENGVFLDVFLVINLDGSASIAFELDDVKTGIDISKKGISFPTGIDDYRFGFDLDSSIEVGPSIGLKLKAFGKDLVDVDNDVLAVINAKSVPGKGEYRHSAPCIQISGYFPKFDITGTLNDDTFVGKILSELLHESKKTIHVMDEHNALLKKDIHFEYEKNGKVSKLIGNTEKVCTHQKGEGTDSTTSKTDAKITDVANYKEIIDIYRCYFDTYFGIEVSDYGEEYLKVENHSSYAELKKYLGKYIDKRLIEEKYSDINNSNIFKEVDGELYVNWLEIAIGDTTTLYYENAKLYDVIDDNTYVIMVPHGGPGGFDDSALGVYYYFKKQGDLFKLSKVRYPDIEDIPNFEELHEFAEFGIDAILDCDNNPVYQDPDTHETTYLVKNFKTKKDLMNHIRKKYATKNYAKYPFSSIEENMTENDGQLYFHVPVFGEEIFGKTEDAYVVSGYIGEKYTVCVPLVYGDAEETPAGIHEIYIVVENGVPKIDNTEYYYNFH